MKKSGRFKWESSKPRTVISKNGNKVEMHFKPGTTVDVRKIDHEDLFYIGLTWSDGECEMISFNDEKSRDQAFHLITEPAFDSGRIRAIT